MFGQFRGAMFTGGRPPFRDTSGRFISRDEYESLLEDEQDREERLRAAREYLETPIEERYVMELAEMTRERERAELARAGEAAAPQLTDAQIDEILSELGLVSETPADRAPTLRIASSVMQQLNAGLPIRMPSADLLRIQDPQVRERLAAYVTLAAQQAGRQMGRAAYRATIPSPVRAAIGPAGEQMAGQVGAVAAPAAVNFIQRIVGIAGRYADPAIGAALVAALPLTHWLLEEDRVSAAASALWDWFSSLMTPADTSDYGESIQRKTIADSVAGLFDNNLESLAPISEARRVLSIIGEKSTPIHRERVFLGLAWAQVRDRLVEAAFIRDGSRGRKTARDRAISQSLTAATPRGVGIGLYPAY